MKYIEPVLNIERALNRVIELNYIDWSLVLKQSITSCWTISLVRGGMVVLTSPFNPFKPPAAH